MSKFKIVLIVQVLIFSFSILDVCGQHQHVYQGKYLDITQRSSYLSFWGRDLSYEDIEKIKPDTFLNTLDFAQLSIDSIPSSFLKNIRHINNLSIAYNYHFVWSKNISELGRIKIDTLEVYGYTASDMDSDLKYICNLTSLLSLRINITNLQNIPREISNLTKLKSLDLSENEIKNIPHELAEIETLTDLNLSDNDLYFMQKNGRLETVFCEMKNRLIDLRLVNCQIESIPKCISKFEKLEWFMFADNYIGTIPEFIYFLPKIKEIYLGNSLISKLPQPIPKFVHVTNNMGILMFRK